MRGERSWRFCSKKWPQGQGTRTRPCPRNPAWNGVVTQARAAAASRAMVGRHLDRPDATREVTQEKPSLGATSQGGASPAAGPTLQNLGKAPPS